MKNSLQKNSIKNHINNKKLRIMNTIFTLTIIDINVIIKLIYLSTLNQCFKFNILK